MSETVPPLSKAVKCGARLRENTVCLEASIVLSATRTVMGTAQYMAPEQAMPDADRPLDGRADMLP